MFNDCLIMAGGSGTRLWPASSSRLPKQFLPANEKNSFFSLALERALSVGERVIIITGKSQIGHIVTDAAKFKASEKKRIVVIGEPVAKNTAPAVACAVVYSLLTSPKRSMIVLTSDHIIKPLKTFKADALLAAKACTHQLIVFGIKTARPETGYGYIETSGIDENGVFEVAAFHEKPDMETAKKYSANKQFFWNSGMFAFNIDFITEQFYSLCPDVLSHFKKLKVPKKKDFTVSKGINILTGWKGLKNAYTETKSISFDYAIAEKCKKTAMVNTNFDWIDIGNWDEYIKVSVNTNSQVFNAGSDDSCYVDSDIPVALAGVDDLIVIIRSGKNGEPPCALITKKGETQRVKAVVELIRNSGRKELL